MTGAPSTTSTTQTDPAGSPGGVGASWPRNAILDVSGIDLSRRLISRQGIERYNAHRGDMALLDWIVWHSDDHTQGVALKHVRDDEFWVAGHFPGKPMLPGVLMVECGAQLSAYLYNARQPEPGIAAFTRIEHCRFPSAVEPGDDLYLLAREVKYSPRRFVTDIQGIANGDRVTFEARIQGVRY